VAYVVSDEEEEEEEEEVVAPVVEEPLIEVIETEEVAVETLQEPIVINQDKKSSWMSRDADQAPGYLQDKASSFHKEPEVIRSGNDNRPNRSVLSEKKVR